MTELLQVSDLRVTLPTARGPVAALRGVSFSLQRGQTLGLIGESGCGKSLTALAVMGLLPDGAQVAGSIRFQGQELIGLDEPALCRLRGRHLGMVFQEPMSALNPLHTIARQVAEPLRLHRRLDAAGARAEALRLLERVQLPQARQRLDAYPHQLSGGERQRVVIAIALACGPDLLIADEPTTALDATLQREMLALVARLVQEDGMALLLISHDLGVMAHSVRQLLVLYAGVVVEAGPAAAVFARRAHPYTQGLFAARPALRFGLGAQTGLAAGRADGPAIGPGAGAGAGPGNGPAGGRGQRLQTIRGRVPDLHDVPTGCPFADRCDFAVSACRDALPVLLPVGEAAGHAARCIRLHDAAVQAAAVDLSTAASSA